MNILQIIGLLLFAVGLVKLLYLRGAIKKGFHSTGRVIGNDKSQQKKNQLTNHPRVEFLDQKKVKRVMTLKVSKSFIEIHAKDNEIDIIYYEGKIYHANELYASLIIPSIGLILLLVGWYF
jgi:hypothetical protein